MPCLRVIGPGRAGGALGRALERAGWRTRTPLERGDPVEGAAEGVDLLVIATPDSAIETVARSVATREGTVVAHLAGSRGLAALAPHPRRAALHPLVSLPDASLGAERLASGAWFAVAGDPIVRQAVADLGGRCFEVPDSARALYHAAACIASNHLVALLGQVERVAAEAGVPLEAYLDLVRATVENVARLGPARALTGPVARGDAETIERHLAALAGNSSLADEEGAYRALAERAAKLLR